MSIIWLDPDAVETFTFSLLKMVFIVKFIRIDACPRKIAEKNKQLFINLSYTILDQGIN